MRSLLRKLAFLRRGPLSPEHLEKGKRAERLAAEWMRREFRVRWREFNWSDGQGELDLIGVAPDGQWIFVEVRSRQENALVSGYHSITRKKKRVLRRTILAYLRGLPEIPSWRFDVVDVAWRTEGEPLVRHFAQVTLG